MRSAKPTSFSSARSAAGDSGAYGGKLVVGIEDVLGRALLANRHQVAAHPGHDLPRPRARLQVARQQRPRAPARGHLSSRYSTIALDSDSEKAPSTSAGTRAVNDVST